MTLGGCGAVYPEVSAPMHEAPKGKELEPPPPADILYLGLKGAEIPTKTRDGRKWDSVGGEKPDPFAIVFVGDLELFRTPVQSDTLNPSWPEGPKANYRVPKGKALRVEIWDSNTFNNVPICAKKFSGIHSHASEGELLLRCDSGAKVTLVVEPGHPKLGVGFFYELRSVDVYITRVLPESPAARVGLKSGDQIVKIQGKSVSKMEEGAPQSAINAYSKSGLMLTVKHSDGKVVDVSLKEGAIYPFKEGKVPE